MRTRGFILLAAVIALLAVSSGYAGLHIGGKFWYQDVSFQFDGAEEVTADGIALGPQASFDLGESLWFSASWMVGALEFEGGGDWDSQDAEGVVALSFDWLDLGVGFRYSEDEFGGTAVSRKYGPMAYAGMGTGFGDTPFGWYAAASWMFVDLNDDWDWGEHVNAEGGLSLFIDPITATVGYRAKMHYDSDNDLLYQGVTGSAGITF